MLMLSSPVLWVGSSMMIARACLALTTHLSSLLPLWIRGPRLGSSGACIPIAAQVDGVNWL